MDEKKKKEKKQELCAQAIELPVSSETGQGQGSRFLSGKMLGARHELLAVDLDRVGQGAYTNTYTNTNTNTLRGFILRRYLTKAML